MTSEIGLRIKATEGDSGTITNVKYDGITLESISKYVHMSPTFSICSLETYLCSTLRYGILIEQNYSGGDLKGSPGTGIPITDLTMMNIYGSGAVSSSGYDVVIVCGSGACSSWKWTGVAVTGGKKYGSCENVPSVTSCS